MSTEPSSTATASTPSTGSARAPAGWRRWELAIGLAALVVGLLLRLNGYSGVPPVTQNADELQFAWLGLSLWQHGVPLTWAYFGPYTHPELLHLHGTVYPLVKPWFDHPPLFGLLTGGTALLGGQRTLAAVDMSTVRIPAVLGAAATIPLVQVLGRRTLGPAVAAVAAILVAVSPPLVLLGRVAEPEAVLAPLLLGALVLTDRLLAERHGRWELPLLIVICLLAPLAKVTGLAVAGAASAVLLSAGRIREAAAAALAGAAAFGIFALYGAVYGWHTFVAVLETQSSHRTGVMGGLEFIGAFAGNNHHLYDGWWLLGWLGVAVLAAGSVRGPAQLVAWPAAAYLATIVLLANQQWVGTYGWYRVAVYPLVYLAAAELAWRLVRSPSLGVAAVVIALGGAAAAGWWLGRPWIPPAWLGIAVFAAILVPIAVAAWRGGRWRLVAAGAGLAALVLMAAGSVVQSLQLDRLASLF